MHAVESVSTQKIEGIVVSRNDKLVAIILPKIYTRGQIPVRRDQIPRPEFAQGWKHLRTIANKIPSYREDLTVGILIGNNCVQAIKPRDIVPGKPKDPYAIRTALGWDLIGASIHTDECTCFKDTPHASCNSIMTKEIGSDESSSTFKFAHPTQHKEVMSCSTIKKMFERDFSETGIQGKSTSHEDRRFLKEMKESIHLTDNGHYEMPLPLRDPAIEFPCNKKLAENRLNLLKRRFDKDPKYKDDYVVFMNEVIKNGYAERAPEEYQKVWYIPHHGVYHPKKPEKIRVVFDCSTKFQGHSLNRHLLQGPDLTNSLVGVLCRFRQEPVAFACDIEGMFHQVKMNEEHRDLLRFLWWDEGDTSQEPKEYRMTVHLFGATSSPGCANLALKTTAEQNEVDIGTEPANFIKTNFYVDDGLKSTKTIQDAISLIKKGKDMCAKGGFRLHKFISNSKEVIVNTSRRSR
ncbi:hypothetical protein QZH41_001948 [Actinostola sp. cb2023]|nr:hypothetical protein QZH41_001948 [Actinostola sp. cb2023]